MHGEAAACQGDGLEMGVAEEQQGLRSAEAGG